MNLFDDDRAAGEYEQARADFHALPVDRLTEWLGTGRTRRALDVGCGTGHSTHALLPLAEWIVGLDPSAAMLRHRPGSGAPQYVRGVAERLPFQRASFDLVSVGLAFHWFDQSAFLAEAARVLKPESWLLVYDSGLCARVGDTRTLEEWLAQYRERFPAPMRNPPRPASDAAAMNGLRWRASERFVHSHRCTGDQLSRYLATQSSVLLSIHQRRHTSEEALSWLQSTLRPYFGADGASVEFEGWLYLLQTG